MPNIILKNPSSNAKIIYVDSKTLPDLYNELNIQATHVNIGTGLLMITQINNEYDEPNIIYEGTGILGTVYCVRFTKDRVTEIKDDDIEYFINEITFLKTDDY